MAFLSYVRADDEHEGGRISQFRERLESEVQFQTDDKTFRIFQDRIDVARGQDWRTRITESLDTAIFLIPVITPRFFGSKPCCDELDCFLARERRLGRRDLVLPLYYENCPPLEDPAKRSENPHAQAIADHQYRDWRELRFASLRSPKVRQRIRGLAKELATALACTSSLAVEPENLISSLAVDAPGLTNKPAESDQALSRTPEHRPPTQADVPARVSEAGTSAELPEKLPEIADRGGEGNTLSKMYRGLVKMNSENLNEPVNVVRVEITDEGGRVVKEYDLEPAPRAVNISFFHGYAWGYAGSGPQSLAEAILFDYTSDVEKTREYRNALIDCEIRHLESHMGFMLGGDRVEAAMLFADRQRKEREQEQRSRERQFLRQLHPREAGDSMSKQPPDNTDIAILVALDKELDAVLRSAGPWERHQSSTDIRTYYTSATPSGLSVVTARSSGMGQINAALLARDMLEQFKPRKVLLVGIAAGLEKMSPLVISWSRTKLSTMNSAR